ncbi:MAG TPA: protein phosphatase 2C domain-containing protein [Rhizomicrobium sp.]|jgi:serine/threonine protein phosphatase PrpC|nr:protein phosphatase 2C domain-containing protein [Rhizomicrobium sp.]
MKLEYIAGLSWPGDRSKPNDDAFCHSDTIAAVFDGATSIGDPVLPSDSDAAWIARKGAECLVRYDILGARGALRRAARDAERDFNAAKLREPAERYEMPLAAMTLVAPEGDGFLALWFGDCAALVQRPGEKVQLIGEAIEKRARESERAARLARELGVSPTEGDNRAQFLPALRKARNRANTVEGSWAFSPMAECAAHAHALAFDAPIGSHILICSDGFLALASDYGCYDADTLMEAALSRGLRPLLEEVRKVEEDDAAGRRFPRFKKSDDATALVVRVV